MNILLQDNLLIVEVCSDKPLSFEEIRDFEGKIRQEFKKHVSKIDVDLKGVSHTDYSSISLVLACSELCREHSAEMAFRNLGDDRLAQALERLGFDRGGKRHAISKKRQKPASTLYVLGDTAIKITKDLGKFVGFTGETMSDIAFLVRNPRKFDVRETLYYMDKSGADAVPIVIMICFLVGMILAFQGLAQLNRFGLDVYIADLVGLSILRELGPLMVAMICIGRAGSAYAAELGTMKVAEELDAMSTMGLNPPRFLVVPKIVALMTVMPMLTVIGDISGIAGGICVSLSLTDMSLTEYFQRTINSLVPENALESLVKSGVFAFIIAGVGCFRGMEADNDAKGVGKATTSAVVTGIFLVIIADALVTFLFPQVMHFLGVSY